MFGFGKPTLVDLEEEPERTATPEGGRERGSLDLRVVDGAISVSPGERPAVPSTSTQYASAPPRSQGNLGLVGNVIRFREQLGITCLSGQSTIQVDRTSEHALDRHLPLWGGSLQ